MKRRRRCEICRQKHKTVKPRRRGFFSGFMVCGNCYLASCSNEAYKDYLQDHIDCNGEIPEGVLPPHAFIGLKLELEQRAKTERGGA